MVQLVWRINVSKNRMHLDWNIRLLYAFSSRFRSEKGFLSVTMLPKEEYLVPIGQVQPILAI